MKKKYGFGKITTYPFLEAIERVKKELEKEGFGILTEIDVSETLQKKLNQQMPPYCILGACNPQIAHRALEIDSSIGLLLPCFCCFSFSRHCSRFGPSTLKMCFVC